MIARVVGLVRSPFLNGVRSTACTLAGPWRFPNKAVRLPATPPLAAAVRRAKRGHGKGAGVDITYFGEKKTAVRFPFLSALFVRWDLYAAIARYHWLPRLSRSDPSRACHRR